MPTYDYQCQTCGHRFEVFQSMKAERLTDCPVEGCEGPVKRLLGTGAGIIFKGSGFYETDYRSDSYKKAAKADAPSSGDSGGKASSGDSKTSSAGDSKGSSTSPAAAPSTTTGS